MSLGIPLGSDAQKKCNYLTVTLKKICNLIANCKAKKFENRFIVESEMDTTKLFSAPEMF